MLVLHDRLLVEFDQAPQMTPSKLIWLPETRHDPAYTGIVKAIGPEHLTVKVGDKIVFSQFAGIPIPLEHGKALAVLDEREVLAVFEEDDPPPVKRTLYALDVHKLLELLEGAKPEEQIIYLNLSHSEQTVYVTTERSEAD